MGKVMGVVREREGPSTTGVVERLESAVGVDAAFARFALV